ncbi:uncharacterized protein LOC128987093 [Macrosteles quadrilineatus]|uniref:uncharacterized protein LOC128987093 n=1 Tax=Macrosteles quadrilineatus TaxID=74068 RepID=UPI0023E23C60|nr:uncharacterized protein LOC128987093 [Macrosteles quadrilineatus]
MPEPTKDDWLRIAQEFNSRANVPNCLGSVDGKHIRIVKPAHSGSLFYNYKKYFSLILMAVTDANYKFIFIDVGSYGKCNDSTVFQETVFHQRVEADTLDLPEDKPISSLNPVPVPFLFLADDAFALSRRVMCPYVGKSLDVRRRTYNYRHCRGRRFVECTFGILANKWRILHRALNVEVDFAIEIVKACCILHNYVRDKDGVQFQDTLYRFPSFHEEDEPPRRGRNYASNVRNIFADYFVNEGAVPWQNDYL